MSHNSFLSRSGLVALMLAAGTGLASAQDAPATPAAEATLPPSTNPAQRVIYAGEGQTTEQQQADQLACYNYATEQTTWDPYQAYGQLEKDHGAALAQYQQTQGGAVRGAAGGALVGLAIGAVAGGAGGGVRARRGRQAAASGFEAAAEEFQGNFQLWDRQWTACMSGRKYGVS